MMNHPYLEDKIIKVKPAPSKGHWGKFVSPDQAGSLATAAPFHPGTVRTYVVPPRAVYSFVDDVTPNPCPDFNGKEMTEKAYFEAKLGINLNPYDHNNCMIKEYNTNTGKLEVTYVQVEDELILDLKNPIDKIKYKVLCQYPSEIARSKAVYDQERRLGLLYVMVDDSPVDEAKIEAVDLKTKAYMRFSEITQDKESILKFLNVAGKVYDHKTDLGILKIKVVEYLESDPAKFIELANDKDADLKWVINLARKKNILDYDSTSKLYKTKNGAALKYDELVGYFKNIKNQKERQELIDSVA